MPNINLSLKTIRYEIKPYPEDTIIPAALFKDYNDAVWNS
jgi:hypothetical protein